MKSGTAEVGRRFLLETTRLLVLASVSVSLIGQSSGKVASHPYRLRLNQHCVVSSHLCPDFLSRPISQFPDKPSILMPECAIKLY